MKQTFLFLLLFSTFFCFAQQAEIDKLRENLIHDALVNRGYAPRVERYIPSNYSKVGEYLNTMNADGGWNDINYAHRNNDWNPLHHLNRVLIMTFNYSKATSQLYQDPKLLEGIEKALNYWYTINPECDNWYKNKIAKQFYFNVIALLLDGKIPDDLHQKMVNDLTKNPTMTGSNRTLLATSTFYKGVLTNNPEMIKLGVTGVTDQIEVTIKEGVQPDYSFHQHGHFIYNGSYGLNFLRESSWLATIVHETEFAYSDAQIKVLRDYYLNGTRWMIRGELIDYNVRGRQVGRADAMLLSGNFLYPILKHLSIADPAYAKDYLSSVELMQNQLPQETLGHKHFYRSDYTIHHREKYSTSLKMCSKRTVGIELNMNSENKLGYWLPYGLTYIYRTGTEYNGIFPIWDWARLPGVTNPYIEIEEKQRGKAHTQQTEFVGGVSNGNYGVSAMDFAKNETSAKKAWFWFDDEWVALGAGIQSSHEASIVTSINQCLQKGEVWVDGKRFKGQQTLSKPTSIFHDEVGYVIPNKNEIQVKAETQTGNMHRIYGLEKDSVYTSDVFSIWFDHGKSPKNGSYEYIVVPGITQAKFNNYSKNLPVQVLSNTKEIQAVKHTKLKICGIVFYEAGQFKISDDLTVKTDKPVLLLFDFKNKRLSVSEPTGKHDEVSISLISEGKTIAEEKINFEQLLAKGLGGKSISIDLPPLFND